jgi:hypothetical protein
MGVDEFKFSWMTIGVYIMNYFCRINASLQREKGESLSYPTQV